MRAKKNIGVNTTVQTIQANLFRDVVYKEKNPILSKVVSLKRPCHEHKKSTGTTHLNLTVQEIQINVKSGSTGQFLTWLLIND